MRKLPTLLMFGLGMPLTIFACVMLLLFHIYHKSPGSVLSASDNAVSYGALPASAAISQAEIEAKDARVEMVRQFFHKYRSPLEPYAKEVVEVADKYSLDFRLIPAIAMQESTLCKNAPKDSFNCWGFGIYGGKVTKFDNYSEAIQTVTKTLALKYKKDGLHTPEEIMSRYTPSSDGSWAKGVNIVLNSLQ